MKIVKFRCKLLACFLSSEIDDLLRIEGEALLSQQLRENGYSETEIIDDWRRGDYTRILKMLRPASNIFSNDRDIHEVFSALEIFLPFYPASSEICFELKNAFRKDRDQINSIKDLIFNKDDVFADFIIKSDELLHLMQLKRYRDDMDQYKICEYLKNKILEYGNDLGDTNLLVMLQPKKSYSVIEHTVFKGVHALIGKLNYSFSGKILLAFNENNIKSYLIEVYPNLKVLSAPLRFKSDVSLDLLMKDMD